MLKTMKKIFNRGRMELTFLFFLALATAACLDSTLMNDFDAEAGIGIAVPIILGIQENSDTTCIYDKISSLYDICTFAD